MLFFEKKKWANDRAILQGETISPSLQNIPRDWLHYDCAWSPGLQPNKGMRKESASCHSNTIQASWFYQQGAWFSAWVTGFWSNLFAVELKKSRKEGWALVHCLVTFTSRKVTHLILGSHYKMKENIWENKACICLAIYVPAANMAFGIDAGHCLTHFVASTLGKAVAFESSPQF